MMLWLMMILVLSILAVIIMAVICFLPIKPALYDVTKSTIEIIHNLRGKER